MKLATLSLLVVPALVRPAFADGNTAGSAAPSPVPTYRLEIRVTGLDDKPSLYRLTLAEGESGRIRTGDHVPYGADAQGIGFDFRLHYATRGPTVLVSGELDVSAQDPGHAGAIVHRVHATNTVPVTPGTPAVFANGTETSTKRHYEVTVDATKVPAGSK
jgi:hypothetical protein